MSTVIAGEALRALPPGRRRATLGGKGAGLVDLLEAGLRVPPFFVVVPAAPDAPVDDALRAEVAAALDALGPGPVAVRSSGVAEDGEVASWAGQLESVLGVEGLDAVCAAIATCRASAEGPRARAYREQRGLPPMQVAVVVQRMVEARTAGVLFTTHPDRPDHALVSAAWGLGEGVVQGRVACDTWEVPRPGEGGEVRAALAHKSTALRATAGGIAEVPVPEPERDRPCLADDELAAIVEAGRRLEERAGRPVDVEFAVDAGGPVFLQVRPITVPVPRGRRLLWDNSNIVESFDGPTTPMTFSFASRAYTIVYQLFCRVMGVPGEVVAAHRPVFHRMIGYIRGRVYYNLNAWYLVLTLLPGFRFNRRFMEQMMGVSEVAEDADALADLRGGRVAEGGRLLGLLLRLAWRLLRLDRDIVGFRAEFEAAMERARARDLRSLEAFDLLELYDELERRLLWAWTPPIVNDFFVMIFYGVLRRRCQALTGDPDTTLHNELLAGQGDLPSVAPTVAALRMAARIRQAPELRDLLLSERPRDEILAEARRHPLFARELEGYLRMWGDRCVDELKLETPSLRQDPGFLVEVLRNYLRAEPLDPDLLLGAEIRRRREATRRYLTASPRWLRWLDAWILGQARRRVRAREDLRFLRTRVFGLVREIVRAFGARLVEAGALDAEEDVFFLRIDEVLDWVRGTAVTVDLRPLVALRRAEFARWRADPPPAARFHTWGPVHAHNRFQSARPAEEAPADGELVGTPCHPGRVEGVARVLADPSAGGRLDGEILVAERTDPGWVPLYPSISGLLVERGSVLSHSAVVAREMGIPTIVGIQGLTARVADGDRVAMDGATGRVERT